MNNNIEYIIKKFNINLKSVSPIMIPNGTREDLADLFFELGFKIGAEIGVERGSYSEILCKHNPNLKLYCVDSWQQYDEYRDTLNQFSLEGYYEETKKRLAPYNCELIKKYSMDAVKDFENNSLDFVYIDGNHHFDYVAQDIINWAKIVRPGGIVSGHDYRKDKNERIPFHIIQATHAYTDAHKISPWFVLGRSTSWFWVKT